MLRGREISVQLSEISVSSSLLDPSMIPKEPQAMALMKTTEPARTVHITEPVQGKVQKRESETLTTSLAMTPKKEK